MSKNTAAPMEDANEVKKATLADTVRGVEQELIQAMLDAALPILEANGYGGFKDVQLLVSQPDEEGNVKQSLRVLI
jgi:hypothetical protein